MWWALRPSLRHPTLELRLTDCCTAINDSVAIAALFRAMVRHAVCHPDLHRNLSAVQRSLVEENRWRAQRYGTDGTYIDVYSLQPISCKSWFERLLVLLSDDIRALQLEPDVERLRTIMRRGTSAHLQLEHYQALRKFGRTSREAIGEISKWLRACTEIGDFVAPAGRERASFQHLGLQPLA